MPDKNNWKQKCKDMGQRVAQGRATDRPEKIRVEGKMCPFMSNADAEVACLESCALYRSGKNKGYECILTELGPLSWSLRRRKEKK